MAGQVQVAISADGTEIVGRVRGQGPPVVLVHGGWGDGEVAYEALVPHLADRFTSAHPEVAVRTVPAAAGDVHDLDGLRTMAAELTAPDADTPTGTPRARVLPARRG